VFQSDVSEGQFLQLCVFLGWSLRVDSFHISLSNRGIHLIQLIIKQYLVTNLGSFNSNNLICWLMANFDLPVNGKFHRYSSIKSLIAD